MQVIAQTHGRTLSAVKSFTLADFTPPPIPRARPRTWADLSLFTRAFRIVKLAVIIWGVISLAAIAGVAIYYLEGARETLLLASAPAPLPKAPPPSPVAVQAAATTAAELLAAPPPAEASASARERLAILMAEPSPLTMAPPSPELAQAPMLTAPAPATAAPATPPTGIEVAESRVPRPRPDEPIFTGSIKRTASDPAPVAQAHRRFGPCSALKSLGVPSLFGNRCGQYTGAYPPPSQPVKQAAAPPPTRQHAPKPYRPPAYISD